MTTDQILELGPELAAFLTEFGGFFGRVEPRRKLKVYISGQLSQLPRKSAEPIALAAGVAPRTLQEFLASDDWEEDEMAETLRRLVARNHGDDQAIGMIDESGHPKKGSKTAGVSRQFCGNAGKIDNCVMTVHLTYVTFDNHFRTMIASDLYLPKCWHEDHDRYRQAKIPDELVYRPKYTIGLELVGPGEGGWGGFQVDYRGRVVHPETFFRGGLGRARSTICVGGAAKFHGLVARSQAGACDGGQADRKSVPLLAAHDAPSLAKILCQKTPTRGRWIGR